MSSFVDTHGHLYAEEFDSDRDEVVARALAQGVETIILPDIDSSTRERMYKLEAEYKDNMYALIGVHPTSIKEDYKQEIRLVEKELLQRNFIGVGEIGLDYYWDTSMRDEQIYSFEYQLGLAQDLHLPVVIHSRKSIDDIFISLKRFSGVQGILHCFPGDINHAKRAIDMGFMIGVGGVVTFKNAKLAEVVQEIGVENIVLETDAPYLTPAPHRGKRNESSYIPIIGNFIAELTERPIEQVAQITTNNAKSLFKI